MTNGPVEPVDVALHLARANLYRFFAAAFLPPEDPRFDVLRTPRFQNVVEAAVDWIRSDPAFHPPETGPGEIHPAEVPEPAWFPDGEEAGQDHLAVFGHTISKDCPPYEGEYYPNRDISFRSQRLADVTGFCRAFGLQRAAGVRERFDHISFEAEFMQVVIARQLFAEENGLGDEPVQVCRQAQRTFFIEHLGWWLPAFGSSLERKAAASRFYAAAGSLLRAFTAAERAVLALPPFTELPEAQPDLYEPEGSCFSCGLDPCPGQAAGGGRAVEPATTPGA